MLLRNNSLVEEIQDSVASNISGGLVDFNGDGTSDLAVVRSSTAGLVWYIDQSPLTGTPEITVGFGGPGDIPIVGDFNGDGNTDIGAVGINPFGFLVWNIDTDLDGTANLTYGFGLRGDTVIS